MKTIYLKTEPRNSWVTPTYYKVTGFDNALTVVEVWNATTLEVHEIDDETFNGYVEYIKLRDLNNPLVECSRSKFDNEYIGLTNKLNALTSV